MKVNNKYDSFIFFSAGPVGDHALLLDFANRFYESTGIKSTLILKHYFGFLSDLSLPYPHIKNINWESLRGRFSLAWLLLSSIWKKNCYVLVLPLRHPTYIKILAYYVRFFTRSRMIGFNLEGSVSFKEKGSAYFLGKKNIIPANLDKELFYEQANRMLVWLGFNTVNSIPHLKYIDNAGILSKYSLKENNYLCMHLMSSHIDRSLPPDRWNKIIKNIQEKIPRIQIVFTGADKDSIFINECIQGLKSDSFVDLCGKVNMQELLNIYKKSKVTVCVHTGNAIIVNMLEVPTVMVTIKGVYMFNYKFNPNATILTAAEGCICDPYERNCNMISYKGNEYMACLFNISDDEIIDSILKKYNV